MVKVRAVNDCGSLSNYGHEYAKVVATESRLIRHHFKKEAFSLPRTSLALRFRSMPVKSRLQIPPVRLLFQVRRGICFTRLHIKLVLSCSG